MVNRIVQANSWDCSPKTDHKSVDTTEVLRGDLIGSNARLFNDFDSTKEIFEDHRTVVLAAIVDISGRKQAEQAVLQNQEQLRAALNFSDAVKVNI